jgi:hypothetical protein
MADAAKEQRVLFDAYKTIFLHSPQGALVLRDLMKSSGLFGVTGIVENAELQHITGTQDMVRRIFGILNLDDDQIYRLAILTEEEGEFPDG